MALVTGLGNRLDMSLGRTARNCTFVVLLAAGLTACAETEPVTGGTKSAEGAAPTMGPITAGTALPAGYKIDAERTIIFGTDERWTGRLSYTTSTSADEAFDFLHKEMPQFGWAEVTAMRSDPSVMTFSSTATSRTAIITIARAPTLGSTRVEMLVSANGNSGAKR